MTSRAAPPTPLRRSDAGVKPVTQARVIRSEWIKLRSVRSSWLMLAATVGAVAAVGLLVAYVTAAHWSTMDATSRADFSPINQTLIGVNLAELTIGVLGVLVATGEYATGMVQATFCAVPRRLPVLVAKAAVLATVTFAASIVGALIAFVGGQALLGAHGISLGGPGALLAALGSAIYLTIVAIIGLGVGFVIRSTAGAIGTVFGVLFVLPIMVVAMTRNSSLGIVRYLPSMAGRAMFTRTADHAMLGPWPGFAVFLLYAALVWAGAALSLQRRAA